MLAAAFWGFVGGFALLLGALIALVVKVPLRLVGLIMAFGAGVLISAVAFELTEEAYRGGGAVPAGAGLLAGSLVFFIGDWLIDHAGGDGRKSPLGIHSPFHPLHRHCAQDAGEDPRTPHATKPAAADHAAAPDGKGAPGNPAPAAAATGSGMALVLGALLDGIPESAAIGISLLGGGGVGTAMIAAVFLSNMPESISATAGLKASGRSTKYILGLWTAVVAASTLAAALGYALLGDASEGTVAFIQTFAAGAIITMLADTMVPEATEHAGRLVGIFTMMGFAVAFFLSALG